VTIKEIANQAALPPGVIHYYFKSKDEIVASLARALVEKHTRMLEEQLAGLDSEAHRSESTLDYAVDELIFNRPLNRVFYNLVQMAFERKDLGLALKAMLQDYRARMAEAFRKIGGSLQEPTIGAALVAVTEGLALQWMLDPDAFSRSEVRELLARAIVSVSHMMNSSETVLPGSEEENSKMPEERSRQGTIGGG